MQSIRGLRADRIALIIIGSLFASLSIRLFIIPSGLLAGGLSGLGLLLHYTLGVPVGLSVFVMNIPIFFLGFRRLQRNHMLRSLIGVVSFTVFLTGWQALLDIREPLVDDLLLTALFGGAINGVGFGLTFRGRGSIGGTDIIALVLNRIYSFSLGSVGFAFNALPVVLGLFLFDSKLLGYTLVAMYVSAYIVDRIQVGLIRSKTVTIVSAKHEEIAKAIIERIHRGVTLLHGQGAFSHSDRKIILTAVSLTQLTRLKDIVAQLDPTAFMTVSDASEVLGKGFGRVRDDDQ